MCHDCPIVAASEGFYSLTGYSQEHMLGRNCRMMLDGVPPMAISVSARKNIKNFMEICQVIGLSSISEVFAVQPNTRCDGSHFVNMFMLGLCKIRHRSFVLGVQTKLGEGLFVKMSKAETKRAVESSRQVFKSIRERLSLCAIPEKCIALESSQNHLTHAVVAQPDFAFFSEQLQDHGFLVDNGYTALRREPQELAFNCMLFSDRPIRHTSQGLSFTVLVNSVTHTFTGLPVLGFTKRRPVDSPDLYPAVARCTGASVLVGACGEAFARDKWEHFAIGFKTPPESEVQYWSMQPELRAHERTPPTKLEAGDTLQCTYAKKGVIQLFQNGNLILEFDVDRPVEDSAEYYAVLDVCFTACSVTVVSTTHPDEEPSDACDEAPAVSIESDDNASCASTATSRQALVNSRQCSGHDAEISAIVKEAVVMKSIKEAVKDCTFMVTIADPRFSDSPLIAVSDEFVKMTGFQRSEILGVNCRFLNQGCDMDPVDLARLRHSSATGAPFAAVLPNRKKSGELFMNLLDLRGLSVAWNPDTGEDLWFLIGIQADVTGLVDDERPTDHIVDLQMVADSIREKLARELSAMAFVGAFASSGHSSSKEWRLLAEQTWKPLEPTLEPSGGLAPAQHSRHDARSLRPDEADVAAGGVAPGAGPRKEEFDCCEFCRSNAVDRGIEDTLCFDGLSRLHGRTVRVLQSIVSFCFSHVLDALQGEGMSIRLTTLFTACLSLTLGAGIMRHMRRSE
jgi:PAS domain-containing protein